MRMIATLQEPDQGSIRFGDIDVLRQKDKVRETLGYLPQEFGLYPNVTAARLLEHFAVLKGITDRRSRGKIVDALLHQTNLFRCGRRGSVATPEGCASGSASRSRCWATRS